MVGKYHVESELNVLYPKEIVYINCALESLHRVDVDIVAYVRR
jgi:hypothetical protein